MSEQEKKEERKGGIAPWMTRSTTVGGRLFGQGTPLGGLKAWMATMAQSKILLLVTAATAAGYSGLGLMDIHGRGFGVPTSKSGGTFFSPSVDSTSYTKGGLLGSPASASGKSALEMFNDANKGAVGDESKAPGEGEAGADAAASDPSASADPNAGALGADAGAMGDPSAALGAMAGGGGVGRLSGSLGGGGGGAGSSASMSLNSANRAGGGDQQARAVSTPPRMPSGMRAKMAASSRGRAAGNTSTLRRLSNMQKAMSSARNAGSEQAYGVHDGQWSSAATPAGMAGADASGVRQDGVGPSISPAEGGGSGNPFEDTKYFPNENYDMAVPDIEETKNATPYQKLVDYAVVLLAISAAMTALSAIVWLLAKIPHMAWLLPVAAGMTKIAAFAAFAAGALGVAIAGFGQYLQGAIFAGTGFLAGILALKAMSGDPTSSLGSQLLRQVGLRVGSAAVSVLGGSLGKVTDSGTEFGKDLIDKAAKKGEQLVGGINDKAEAIGKGIVGAPETAREAIERAEEQINQGPPKSGGGAW